MRGNCSLGTGKPLLILGGHPFEPTAAGVVLSHRRHDTDAPMTGSSSCCAEPVQTDPASDTVFSWVITCLMMQRANRRSLRSQRYWTLLSGTLMTQPM